ncbi:MAG: hypothetical protein IJ141_04130 [Lachnospiraceae bacterium]|nr:hypothetical protein [Lachnospiraceae bacterium]
MLIKSKTKKFLAGVLCGIIFVSGNSAFEISSKANGITVAAEKTTYTESKSGEWLLLSPENFPDDTFRWFIMLEHDSDGNGLINPDEVESVSCYCGLEGASKVYSIEGIEYFKNLKMLNLNDCEISDVDLSQNTKLTSLTISSSNLDSIDLSNNKLLTEIRLDGNDLTSLDLSNNPNIETLRVFKNKLTSLDLDGLDKIKEIYISGNPIDTLDLSNKNSLIDGTVSIDRNQSVILPEGGVESLWISVDQYESILDLNKIQNFDFSYLWGVEETSGSEALYYNRDTNCMYYSLNKIKGGMINYNNGFVWEYPYSDYIYISNGKEEGRKLLYISVDLSAFSDIVTDGSIDDDKIYEKMYEKPFAEYNGYKFYKDVHGESGYENGMPYRKETTKKINCVDKNGNLVKNSFVFDGVNTYYFQEDGTAMQDRLTYHPDGEHIIYFNEGGHEVFSNFAHVKHSIEGNEVDDYCFFDVFGYMYVDVLTYDKTGTVLYYANPYGVMEMGKWFRFSDTVKWADGTEAVDIAGGYGYANSDGTLLTNTQTTDWEGRSCYLQGNGVAAY